MKNLIKFLAIIGLVSMSHVAVAIDDVADGDVLTADTLNEIIDATNENSAKLNFDFDITAPCGGLPNRPYKVGETGPGGGLVFYVTSDGCDGLEAWTADEATDPSWGCLLTKVQAAGTAIGTGAPNTALIIGNGCTNGTNAADLTRVPDVHGVENDWYLPSRDELFAMYNAIGPSWTGNGGFDLTAQYWSSSEATQEQAWVVEFGNGGRPDFELKSFNNKTRAIRTFTQD